MTIKTLETLDKLAQRYSEIEMTDWCYDGIFGSVRIEGNPYEGQIWAIIPELQYVDNITKIELRLAEDIDDDYDILDIDYIEIRPKKTLEEYRAILGLE